MPVFWPCHTRSSQMSSVNSGVTGLNFTKFSDNIQYRIICAVNAHIVVAISHSISECHSDKSGEFAIYTARCYAKRGICRRRVSVCPSVCVCVSVTLRYCIKPAKRRIMQITPYNSPGTLVFWHQRSWRNSKGITPYGGDKCTWGGLKFVTFDE